MILLERLADLPSNVKFKCKTSKIPCEDADFVFYHKFLNFYSCFFNIVVIELKKRKGKVKK
jgi:hypothetical protein